MIPFDTPDAEKLFASAESTSETHTLPDENSIQPMQEGETDPAQILARPVPKISTEPPCPEFNTICIENRYGTCPEISTNYKTVK